MTKAGWAIVVDELNADHWEDAVEKVNDVGFVKRQSVTLLTWHCKTQNYPHSEETNSNKMRTLS